MLFMGLLFISALSPPGDPINKLISDTALSDQQIMTKTDADYTHAHLNQWPEQHSFNG
jgi:hypothetical protein